MEVDTQTIQEIQNLLKRMYDMCMMSDIEVWSETDIQKIMVDGGDLYADYFRNNN